MSIIAGYLLPHAPVFIDKVGGGQTEQVQNTINAYRRVAKEIEQMQPDLIIIISPHGPIFSDAIALYDLDQYHGDMKRFGEYSLSFDAQKDKVFIEKLLEENRKQDGYFYPLTNSQFAKFQHAPVLDHGVTVPLYFISEHLKAIKLVALSYGSLSYLELLKNGEIIKKVADESQDRIVIIASGDMSHALSSKGPYQYHEDGPWFDQMMRVSIEKQQPYNVFTEDENRINNAAECGLRSYAIMMGAFNRCKLTCKVYSYEGPFGVGYLIAGFKNDGQPSEDQIEKISVKMYETVSAQRHNAHTFVKIAREMIETYVKEKVAAKWHVSNRELILNGKYFDISDFLSILNEKHGTFVSIKKHGVLRGCIGTIAPTQKTTFEEILQNAISACARDYRFDPIDIKELDYLTISVDILSSLRKVEDRDLLDPSKYGVVVYSKGRKGVLLPNLEGVNTIEEQLQISTNKGGFTVEEIDRIDCFTVERFY